VKNVLITGASHGIGRACVTDFSRKGWSVIATSQNRDELERTRELTGVSANSIQLVAADLATDTDIDDLVQACSRGGDLHGFVHCASGQTDPERDAELSGTPSEVIDAILAVTIRSTILLLKQLMPLLSAGAPSNIVLLASDWALSGSEGPPVFSAGKATVAHLVLAMRRELLSRGIRASVIYAGDVATYDRSWTTPKWKLVVE